MILVIDNYDSFTFNLVQYLREMSPDVRVYRNDALAVAEIDSLQPDYILISPGPGNPGDAGISKDVIRRYAGSVPILGVCLGHQCIAEVYGGKVARAARLMHGKTSLVYHTGEHPFEGISNPFFANRYHSLMVYDPLPTQLVVTARTDQGEIMGLRHTAYPVFGVQFHPESILTPEGKKILLNFISGKLE